MSKTILRKRTTNFTNVSNKVIKVLKHNLQALGFYVHLLSLPDNWDFYKTQLSKDCGIGIKKVDFLLRILKDHGLLKYGQHRNSKGRFENFYIDIYDLDEVNTFSPDGNSCRTVENVVDKSTSPDGNSCRTVETVGRSGEAIKKEIQSKQITKENKQQAVVVFSDELEEAKDFILEGNEEYRKIDEWMENMFGVSH